MIRTLFIVILLLVVPSTQAQETLEQVLQKYNSETVPYITVKELNRITQKEGVVILDSREKNEYKVSHLPKAIQVGYDSFSLKTITEKLLNKDQLIVVYCTLGVRSFQVARQLQKAGYTNVKNLYGGICEWKNEGNQVLDYKEKTTDRVHTFSKEWSSWLENGKAVYE